MQYKLQILNLNYHTTEDELIALLASFNCKDVLIPLSPYPLRNSRSRPIGLGYAFFDSAEDADRAIDGLTKSEFKSRTLLLRYHEPYSPGVKGGAFKSLARLKEPRSAPVGNKGSPLLTLNGQPEVEEERAAPEIKRSGAYGRGFKIMNGLKPKSEAAKAVTSTTIDIGDAKDATAAQAPESEEPVKVPEKEVPTEISEDSALDMAAAPCDIYSENTIFIRNLRGKVTQASIMNRFKSFNPVKVKITRAKRAPRTFSTRTNVLVAFDFQDGMTIDQVLDACQTLEFNGHSLEVFKALLHKTSPIPSPREPTSDVDPSKQIEEGKEVSTERAASPPAAENGENAIKEGKEDKSEKTNGALEAPEEGSA